MGNGPNVLIGKDCRVNGRLSLAGEVAIDGTVEGEIVSDGDLTVTQSGVVDAKLHGTRVHIFGRVVGEIHCSERLELHAGAKVYGNLRSPSVVMEDGVSFEGHCSMEQEREEVKLEKESTSETSSDEVVAKPKKPSAIEAVS